MECRRGGKGVADGMLNIPISEWAQIEFPATMNSISPPPPSANLSKLDASTLRRVSTLFFSYNKSSLWSERNINIIKLLKGNIINTLKLYLAHMLII